MMRKKNLRKSPGKNLAKEQSPTAQDIPKIPDSTGSVVGVEASSSFTGPLPPPAMFGKYEELVPGSAERILAMAEKEQSYRIDIGSKTVDAAIKSGKMTNYFALITSLTSILMATLLALTGNAPIAFLVGSPGALTALAKLLGLFLAKNGE